MARIHMRRLLPFVFGFCLLLGWPAAAQIVFPHARQASGTVTVLSDALAEPDSRSSQILGQFSVLLDNTGGLRTLVINGYGGPRNIRDLLQLRGVDFAVVNSDVFAYLDTAKAIPEARQKVRLAAPLFHQRVLLFAKKAIATPGDLKGRKVGVPANRPSRGVTAKTVFATLKIDAHLIEIEEKDFAKKAADELDAVLLFEQDAPRLRTLGLFPGTYRLLAVPATGPLAKIYLPGKVSKAAAGEWSASGDTETVQVTTVLAAFDWGAGQARYATSAQFTAKFFEFLPQLRRDPKSPLARTDVRKGLPGWQRFAAAEAPAAAAAPPAAGEDTLRLAAPLAETAAALDTLRLLAAARPPLANPQAADGGVAVKVLTEALAAAGVPVSLQWADDEQSMAEGLAAGKTADVGLFWHGASCEAPHHQSAAEAELCDRAAMTEPVMQAVAAVFTRLDVSLETAGQDAQQSRTVCVPQNQPVPDEALSSIAWIKTGQVKFMRPKTLIDCLAAVDRREADALIAIEPEARYAIEKLKLHAIVSAFAAIRRNRRFARPGRKGSSASGANRANDQRCACQA